MLPAAAELVERIRWLITLRWLAIVSVTLGVEVVRRPLGVTVASVPIWWVMALLAAYNLLLATVSPRSGAVRPAGERTGPSPLIRSLTALACAPAQFPRVWLALGRLGRRFALPGARRWRGEGARRPAATLDDLLVPRELWGLDADRVVAGAATLASAQITVDLVAVAALVHFSGGLENPFIFYSVFHVVFASILLSRPATFLKAALGFALIAGVGLGEWLGLLPHVPLGLLPAEGAYRSGGFVLTQLSVLGSTLFLTAYIASAISAHQRSYERETVQLSADVRHKNELLQAAYKRLRGAERAKSQYMRKVAHELKEPLAAIQMLLRTVQEGFAGEFPERSRHFLERAELRARELALLTQDLLTLSRAREGRAAVEAVEVRPDDLVEAAVGALQDAATRAGVAVTTDIAPALGPIEGDAAGLHQLLGNLVSNAIRYTPSGGRVAVRLWQSGAKAIFEVADTGIGIPTDDLPRVFDEFFRSANARARTGEGTGLGLSIVKAVAEQHGGAVSVESTVGVGTRVVVELPLKEEVRR
jgi:signal transduction histidine kinase